MFALNCMVCIALLNFNCTQTPKHQNTITLTHIHTPWKLETIKVDGIARYYLLAHMGNHLHLWSIANNAISVKFLAELVKEESFAKKKKKTKIFSVWFVCMRCTCSSELVFFHGSNNNTMWNVKWGSNMSSVCTNPFSCIAMHLVHVNFWFLQLDTRFMRYIRPHLPFEYFPHFLFQIFLYFFVPYLQSQLTIMLHFST